MTKKSMLPRSVQIKSGNNLPTTPREKEIVKWFLKMYIFGTLSIAAWYTPVMEYEKLYPETIKPIIINNVQATTTAKEIIKPEQKKEYEEIIREVTMYNAGDINQCDETPCISANGENICLALELGYNRCAANFVPFGTKLHIAGFGDCLVTDRMNSRYKNRVDIALPFTPEQHQRAINFGIQRLNVKISNKNLN